jgi:hypothetical protein
MTDLPAGAPTRAPSGPAQSPPPTGRQHSNLGRELALLVVFLLITGLVVVATLWRAGIILAEARPGEPGTEAPAVVETVTVTVTVPPETPPETQEAPVEPTVDPVEPAGDETPAEEPAPPAEPGASPAFCDAFDQITAIGEGGESQESADALRQILEHLNTAQADAPADAVPDLATAVAFITDLLAALDADDQLALAGLDAGGYSEAMGRLNLTWGNICY